MLVDYAHAFFTISIFDVFIAIYTEKKHDVNFLLAVPVNILHGLGSGWPWADLTLPHSCPSWLSRGWASPSAAQVLAGACPIAHAEAIDWACHSWSMSKHMIGQAQSGMPKQKRGQA